MNQSYFLWYIISLSECIPQQQAVSTSVKSFNEQREVFGEF